MIVPVTTVHELRVEARLRGLYEESVSRILSEVTKHRR